MKIKYFFLKLLPLSFKLKGQISKNIIVKQFNIHTCTSTHVQYVSSYQLVLWNSVHQSKKSFGKKIFVYGHNHKHTCMHAVTYVIDCV